MNKDRKKMEKLERKYIELKLEGYIDSKDKISQKCNIDKSSIKTIAKTVQKNEGMTPEQYQLFQDTHNDKIKSIKSLYTPEREDGFKGIITFYDWYMQHDKVGRCCYCGVHKDDLERYFNENNPQYANARQRGKTLEIERVVTSPTNEYSPKNCRLACYICNNAKSDFLSPKDFKPIAKGIYMFWKQKGINAKFDDKSNIWNMQK